MIDDNFRDELTNSMNKSIVNLARKNIIIGSEDNLHLIASSSSGTLKINPSVTKKFILILSQPLSSAFNPFEIRCSLCKRVISYPAWYYSVKYAVNHFHYFVCFDSASPNKPSVRCYKSVSR